MYLSSLPSSVTDNTKCIIMLHGVGSNESDLFALKSSFSEHDYVFSLQGPFHLGGTRYAWYRVDFSTGKPVYEIDEVMIAYSYITDFIKNILQKHSLKSENIFLMGFSQGAIMSYYTLIRSPELIGGIIALSGRLLKEVQSLPIDKERFVGKRVFICHGTEDNVIDIRESEKASEFLKRFGVTPLFKIYSAPHTILYEEVEDIKKWIQD